MPRGGLRQGGGRPKGSRDFATKQHMLGITELARTHTEAAILALVEVCRTGSDAARVSAANALLDRGYGKPTFPVEHSGPGGKPIQIEDVTRDASDFARAMARLAAGEDGGGAGEADA